MQWKRLLLGIQHLFTMFGATILVPYLTGIPVSVALFTSGVGTLIFHVVTKGKVPVYLGSSFAFIAPIISVTSYYAAQGEQALALGYATGGIMIAGLVYIAFSFLIYKVGIEKVTKVFNPLISGTMIMLIGLILAPVAIGMASSNWALALVAIVTMVVVKMLLKGFVSMLPVLIGIFVGYIVAAIAGQVTIEPAAWISWPAFYLPRFSWYALSIIVPAAIAPAIEHIGDVYAVSMVTGKKFYDDPGMHRTLLGDGIATSFAGFLGGPANTTYSENTGVLAFTGVFDPWVMRIAAIGAIILSFVPAVESFIASIPQSVMGGVSIILFGMIASIGARTLIQNKVQMNNKNVIIMSLMLVSGLGGASITAGNFSLEGLGLAAIIGIVCQLIIPEDRTGESQALPQEKKK